MLTACPDRPRPAPAGTRSSTPRRDRRRRRRTSTPGSPATRRPRSRTRWERGSDPRPDQRARLLRQQRSRLLGVTFAVNSAFDADVIESLYRAVDNTGYDLVLSATTPDRCESRAIESLLGERCDTLVLISPDLHEGQLRELTARASVVTIGSDLRAPGADSVRSDDHRGITEAVDHLAELGHRSISYLKAGTAVLGPTRRAAYETAMRDHGLEEARVLTGEPTEQSGAEMANRLLREDALPTAILAHNDMIAVGMLLTLRAHGVGVPGDVSVIGYDNSRMAELSTVGLTSVSQDADQLARAAVERAVARTEEPSAPEHADVRPPRLVVRETSGKPR